MTQAVPYVKTTNFTQYATNNPAAPYQSASLDSELNNVADFSASIQANLKRLQRDDGMLHNAMITPFSLDNAIIMMMQSNAWNPKGAWQTGVSYMKYDLLYAGSGQSTLIYLVTDAHVSSVLLTDVASGKLMPISSLYQNLPQEAVRGMAKMKSASVFTMPDDSVVPIPPLTLESVSYDTYTLTTTPMAEIANHRFRIPVTGFYRIKVSFYSILSVADMTDDSVTFTLDIVLNSASNLASNFVPVQKAANDTLASVSTETVDYLTQGDYITFVGYSSASVSTFGVYDTIAEIEFISPATYV